MQMEQKSIIYLLPSSYKMSVSSDIILLFQDCILIRVSNDKLLYCVCIIVYLYPVHMYFPIFKFNVYGKR